MTLWFVLNGNINFAILVTGTGQLYMDLRRLHSVTNNSVFIGWWLELSDQFCFRVCLCLSVGENFHVFIIALRRPYYEKYWNDWKNGHQKIEKNFEKIAKFLIL